MPNPDWPADPSGSRPQLLLITGADSTGREALADEIQAFGYPVTTSVPDLESALAAAADVPPDLVMVDAVSDLTSAPVDVGRAAATDLAVPLVLLIPGDEGSFSLDGSTDPGHVLLTAKVTQAKLDRCVELARLRHQWEGRYRLLFERNVAGVSRESADGKVIECNPALAAMLGYERPADLEGSPSDTFFADPADAAAYRNLLAGSGQVAGYEARMVRRDGSEIWILDNSTVVEDASGNVVEIVRTLVDVTDRKAREDDLAHMAYHDALTGLGNRRLLRIQAEQVLALADRREGRAALLFLDVVDFKDINDEFGHRVGDEVLKEVARRLGANLRTADVSARTGGDEFAVLLAHVEDARTARIGAERLNQRLSEPMEVDGATVDIETRIGVALFPDDGPDLDTLMALADVALTEAKGEGGPVIKMTGPEEEA